MQKASRVIAVLRELALTAVRRVKILMAVTQMLT